MENKQLIKEIKKLRKEITPSIEWVNFSKSSLLQQINPQNKYHEEQVGVRGYFNLFIQTFRQSFLEPAVVMLLVLGTFLGSSLAINAAFYSLPGEPLYKVKLALEKTHMVLTPEEQKAELQVEFVQKRVTEFEKIVSTSDIEPQEKKRRIQTVAKEFKNNIAEVNNQLVKINQTIKDGQGESAVSSQDKEKTFQMAVFVSEKTKELVKSFDEKVNNLSQEELEDLGEIVGEVVESVQEINAPTEQTEGETGETGEVKGADYKENTETKAEEPVLNDESSAETAENGSVAEDIN